MNALLRLEEPMLPVWHYFLSGLVPQEFQVWKTYSSLIDFYTEWMFDDDFKGIFARKDEGGAKLTLTFYWTYKAKKVLKYGDYKQKINALEVYEFDTQGHQKSKYPLFYIIIEGKSNNFV